MTAAGAQLRDPKRAELLSRVQSGFLWKLASGGLSQVLNTVLLVLLARLLAPKQFGIAAMAEVISAFVIAYSDCGLGLALVQKEAINDADRSTVFWASVTLGAAMAGVCVAVAPLLAAFYHTPEVGSLLDVLSLSFLFTGIGSTHRSLHFRAMNFRALELRAMAASTVTGVVTVVIALSGGGAWAIIVGDVVGTAVSTLLLLAMGGWFPGRTFKWQSLRALGAFGLRYVGGTTLRTLNENADNVLVGRVLGQAALGTYTLAYRVILVPLSQLAGPLAQLLAPAFARFQQDKQAVAANWIRGTRLLLMIFLPLMFTIAITAPDVVHIVFGHRWDRTIPLIRILAPLCALLSIQGFSDAVLQAIGAMRTYLWMSWFAFSLNITAFFLGVQWGLVGMATAFGIAVLIFMVTYLIVVMRALGVTTWLLITSLQGVAGAAAALVLVELALSRLLGPTGMGSLSRLAVIGTSGIVVFGLVCFWRERPALLDLFRLAVSALPLPRSLIPQALQSA